mgnify:CR=1 FL=1
MHLQNLLPVIINRTEQVQLITKVRVQELRQEVTEHRLLPSQATVQLQHGAVVAVHTEAVVAAVQAEAAALLEVRVEAQVVHVLQEVQVAAQVVHVLPQAEDNNELDI